MSLITWNKAIILSGLLAATLGAQNPVCGPNYTAETTCNEFDARGNATLSGTYFVRMVEIAGLSTSGTALNTAYTVTGMMTFSLDTSGNGTYSFTGQQNTSTVTTGPASFTATGFYAVSANGSMLIQDPLFTSAFLQGTVGAAGPSAFSVSRPSGNIAFMVGIPVSSAVASLSGPYYGGYFDLYNASPGSIREASFPFTSDGKGSLGTLTVTGIGTDLGNTSQIQQLAGVGYSFASNVGTVNFGGAPASNFISGSQTFYVSNDGSLILGGSAGDYDIFVGIQSLASAATPASLQGIYLVGGLENDSSHGGENIFQDFTGSVSATGAGASINHRQVVRSDVSSTLFTDETFASTYTIPASGVFTASDNYRYALGTKGTFLASGQNELESLVLGLQTPAYSGSGVWLNPVGVVNAANSAPFTNPVAPNEIVTLYGTDLAPSTTAAPPGVFPLPSILDGVQVYVNGSPAPLLYVSSSAINVLSPSSWYPNNGWGYVTFQVYNNGTYSNAVRVFAQNNAPGVFGLGGSATGQGAILHANTSVIADSSNPAHPGDIVSIFATGLGITADQPDVDGSAGLFSPLTSAWSVYMGGVQCDPLQISNYAGLAPYYAGLYQINVTVPSGTGTGNVPVEVILHSGTPHPNAAQTVETTINIQP